MDIAFTLQGKIRLPSIYTGLFCLILFTSVSGQETTIKGFLDAGIVAEDKNVSFNFGEQDLFITSELSDRFSFLGETVFRYDPESHTQFSISVERVIVKYNYSGNHNLLLGKHHTPINYWNDTYHHGRLFFPTIERPLLFAAEIIPLHTTGIGFQGQNLGKLRFGYDLMIGNGLGSPEISDNDTYKSWTAAIHIKPADRMRIGVSYYNDVISEGAEVHEHPVPQQVNQQLYTGSVAYFGKKFELLAEVTLANNQTDSTGSSLTQAIYAYAGYKLSEKWIPYFRVDYLHYEDGELYFEKDNTRAILAGIRYQVNYLTVIKLEYQYEDEELNGSQSRVRAQVAVGF